MRIDDLSFSDPEFLADPYPVFAELRAQAPVQWHAPTGMWLAFSHRASSDVLRSRSLGRLWSPRFPEISMPAFELIHVHSLLESEPPVHTRLRRLIAGAFSRGHVERLRPAVDALAGRLAGDLAAAGADGPVDLIAHYAEPLPVGVIAELLGIPPTDRHLLRPWSNAIVKMYEYGITPEQRDAAERASAEFVEHLRALVERRRVEPGDDLMSSLLAEADADGSRLSMDELVTTGTLLLNAGHEATVNVVGNGFAAMLARPDVLATVRENLDDDAFVATAVEELIRFDAPLQLFERTATSDVEIGGVVVEKGQKIAALLGAANRDPEVFADPDTLDVTRDPNPQIGFGAGIHFCVGAPLARIELQTTLRTLVGRFPDLALAAPPPRRPEFVIRGVERLPVSV
ncbi:cytochrome P450 [Jatrophihabitans sp. YIM 134969]